VQGCSYVGNCGRGLTVLCFCVFRGLRGDNSLVFDLYDICMGQETDFHSVGFSSVDSIEAVDTDDCYIVASVTFGDGNEGELLYPYRVNSAISDSVVIDSGPQGGFVRVPVSSGDGKDGYRKQSIGLTSDVPSWVRGDVSSLVVESEFAEEMKRVHNLRELDFKF